MPATSRPTASLNSATALRAVTPHASNDLPDGPCRALWVNDTGAVTVAVVAIEDTAAVTITISGPGEINVATKAVRASGTSATNIVAMY